MNSEASSGLSHLVSRAQQAFAQGYGRAPALLIAAPGRVNLIGEHTDYNDGFVLPAAIDRHVVIGARARADRQVHLYAADFAARAEFSLNDVHPDPAQTWSNYERGVAWVLQEGGYRLQGM